MMSAHVSQPSPGTPDCERDDEHTVIVVRREADLQAARMFAREAGNLIGLRGYAGQKVVTAVGELARNIVCHAGEGCIRLRIDVERERLIVIAEDRGPGIANLDDILAGLYRSRTGLGRGLIGARRLADEFEVETGEHGTRVEIAFCYAGQS